MIFIVVEEVIPESQSGGNADIATMGLILGFIRDRFDNVYHDAKEVKEALNLPLLGEIPFLENFKGVREDKRFILKDIDDQEIYNQSGTIKKELINKKTNYKY